MPTSPRLLAFDAAGLHALPVPTGATDLHGLLAGQPLGVYTAFRSWGFSEQGAARFFGLEEHFDRFDRSMELLGWGTRLDRDRVRRALQEGVGAYLEGRDGDAIVRLDAHEPSGGERAPERMLLGLAPHTRVPEPCLREGVRVELADGLRRPTPRIKEASFAVERHPFPLNRQDSYEHLLLDEEERVLEGTSANIFAVRGGVLRTAGEGVLEGITRRFVIASAEAQGLPLRPQALTLEEFASSEEAFLSSSTRLLVPIVNVAGRTIGSGSPGPWTGRLRAHLAERIERESRPAWPRP